MHNPVPSHGRTFARFRVRLANTKKSRQRIAPEVIQHERTEPVKPFAQIDRRAVGVHSDLARGANHVRSRSTVMSPAGSSPSMRKPCGVTSTGLVGTVVVTGAGATAT